MLAGTALPQSVREAARWTTLLEVVAVEAPFALPWKMSQDVPAALAPLCLHSRIDHNWAHSHAKLVAVLEVARTQNTGPCLKPDQTLARAVDLRQCKTAVVAACCRIDRTRRKMVGDEAGSPTNVVRGRALHRLQKKRMR